jgi:hypothetical protein
MPEKSPQCLDEKCLLKLNEWLNDCLSLKYLHLNSVTTLDLFKLDKPTTHNILSRIGPRLGLPVFDELIYPNIKETSNEDSLLKSENGE